MTIFILMTTALLPLIVMTLIYYQLIETSINTESSCAPSGWPRMPEGRSLFFWKNGWPP
jgi:hypothetical protein